MKQKNLNFTNFILFKFSLLLLFLFIFLQSCSNENSVNNDGDDENNDTVTTVRFFPIEENLRWKMQNSIGDTAYFQTGKIDTFSFAKTFWDTVSYNRINMLAIPIEFIYWEQNMKKREYFALGIADSNYFFAKKTNPMIQEFENYPLDFYSVYFSIPNKFENDFIEKISDTLKYFTTNYAVSTVAEWKQIEQIFWQEKMQNKWNVICTSERQTVEAKTYKIEFQFLENIGFYKYKDYELVTVGKQ